MAEIDRIEILVHPDFNLMNNLDSGYPFIHHPEEIELRKRWDAMALSVAKDPASRLIYPTWLSERELQLITPQNNPWKDLDFKRIKAYQLMIGNRMTVLHLDYIVTPSVLSRVLRGDAVSPEARLYRQGEWSNACVEGEGRKWGDLLKIQNDNEHRILVENNSRLSVRSRELLMWHKSLNRAA